MIAGKIKTGGIIAYLHYRWWKKFKGPKFNLRLLVAEVLQSTLLSPGSAWEEPQAHDTNCRRVNMAHTLGRVKICSIFRITSGDAPWAIVGAAPVHFSISEACFLYEEISISKKIRETKIIKKLVGGIQWRHVVYQKIQFLAGSIGSICTDPGWMILRSGLNVVVHLKK